MGVLTALEDSIDRRITVLQFFTDREAWSYFRVAALGEAVGWTLLISGLLIKHFFTPGNNDPVVVAGQIHGTIFLVYIVSVVVLSGSLGWRPRRILIAGLASIPPYGTLIFEQWAARQRKQAATKTYRQIVVRAIIINKDTILAVEPADSGFRCLPGGNVDAIETAESALKRIVGRQLGVEPEPGRLAAVLEYRHRGQNRLELFFRVTNDAAFRQVERQPFKAVRRELDSIGFIVPTGNTDLRPDFLRDTTTLGKLRAAAGNTLFMKQE
jgi:integral membrane protein